MLPEEDSRATSPLVKKRSPKRRIDFKNDDQNQSTSLPLTKNSSDDGALSWADMVKNGYQRSTSDDNSTSKQKRCNENSSKDVLDSSSVRASNNSSRENTSIVSSKFNKETNQCCTETQGLDITRKSSNSSNSSTITELTDRKASCSECLETVVDPMNMNEDEGWEVVSRNRGKLSKKGFYKVYPAVSSAYNFPVSDISNDHNEEKESCHDDNDNVDLDCHIDNDPGVDHHHSNIDPDHDGNIDSFQHVKHHHDYTDYDQHGNVDPNDAGNYNWQHQSKTDVKEDNDVANEDDSVNSLQRTVNSTASSVVINRAVSPYTQVSSDHHKGRELTLVPWMPVQ